MKKLPLIILVFLVLSAMIAGCASMGTPGGGARDEDPPRLVAANPLPGATDVDRERIVLDFNEIVTVKDAFSNVTMSPPAKSLPRVSANGRRVTIQLPDSLAPNTTYTIDFGNSIQDNNEGNKLKGFTYTFSTGPVLDSLRVAGMVLGAKDLEPQQGIYVGLYPASLSDSAFMTEKLRYLAKTDDRGRFIVRGLPADTFRIVALKDNDNDFKYANPEEDLAFYDSFVVPTSERVTVSDTVLNLKTGAIDTIVSRERTVFLPNTILLRSFNTGKRTQYLVKYERPDSARITLQFNTAADSLPGFSIPGTDLSGVITERSATNDTITYWLPRHIASRDTLRAGVIYLRPDSAGMLVPSVDSLNFIYKRPKIKPEKPKKNKDGEVDSVAALPKAPVLRWSSGTGSTQEVWRDLEITFDRPLEYLDTASFRLEQKVDTLWLPTREPLTYARADSLNPRRHVFTYPWESGMTYRLLADSAAAVSIYGEVMERISQDLTTKPIEDYATFRFHVSGLPDSVPAFIELLNSNDQPQRTTAVVDGDALFRFINPGKYYARLTLDYNGDGVWTPGDYAVGVAPDEAFYYPKSLNIKKNWDYDQTWNLWDTPVDLQKPENLKKNKPEYDKRAKQNTTAEEEDEEDDEDPFGANTFRTNNNRGRSGRNSGSLSF